MRSSLSSSTPPLSQGANKPPFSQFNLTPVSPQTSINGEDTQPQPGFGWEFEYALEDRMCQKQHEVNARFQRYGRFGMRREEARLPTPDHLRQAYDELVHAIENDRTPSLSPDSAIADTRYPQRANATQRHLGPKATTKKGLHRAIKMVSDTLLMAYLQYKTLVAIAAKVEYRNKDRPRQGSDRLTR